LLIDSIGTQLVNRFR